MIQSLLIANKLKNDDTGNSWLTKMKSLLLINKLKHDWKFLLILYNKRLISERKNSERTTTTTVYFYLRQNVATLRAATGHYIYRQSPLPSVFPNRAYFIIIPFFLFLVLYIILFFNAIPRVSISFSFSSSYYYCSYILFLLIFFFAYSLCMIVCLLKTLYNYNLLNITYWLGGSYNIELLLTVDGMVVRFY